MEIKKLDTTLSKAIDYIKSRNLSEAHSIISQLLPENDHSPELHNLLGIIAELSGKFDLAVTQYRISCTIDQSYAPSNRNLQRITSFYYKPMMNDIDFGDKK